MLHCITAFYTAETLPWIIKILAGRLAQINGRKDENSPVDFGSPEGMVVSDPH